MEIINFSPRLKKSRDFPEMREMILMPIGDIQYGPHSDNDKLARHVAWGVRRGRTSSEWEIIKTQVHPQSARP